MQVPEQPMCAVRPREVEPFGWIAMRANCPGTFIQGNLPRFVRRYHSRVRPGSAVAVLLVTIDYRVATLAARIAR
jgi:hypothetical protein